MRYFQTLLKRACFDRTLGFCRCWLYLVYGQLLPSTSSWMSEAMSRTPEVFVQIIFAAQLIAGFVRCSIRKHCSWDRGQRGGLFGLLRWLFVSDAHRPDAFLLLEFANGSGAEADLLFYVCSMLKFGDWICSKWNQPCIAPMTSGADVIDSGRRFDFSCHIELMKASSSCGHGRGRAGTEPGSRGYLLYLESGCGSLPIQG